MGLRSKVNYGAMFERCHTVLGVKLSLTMKNTLTGLYGMRNTIFPRILKIGAESLNISPEEGIFNLCQKVALLLLHDVQVQGIELQDQEIFGHYCTGWRVINVSDNF